MIQEDGSSNTNSKTKENNSLKVKKLNTNGGIGRFKGLAEARRNKRADSKGN